MKKSEDHSPATPEQQHYPGDCHGCGAPYPYCDCYACEGAAETREGYYTAMEIISEGS